MTTRDDVETVFGPEGAMEAIIKNSPGRQNPPHRFSAHSEEAALPVSTVSI
jgi:hypothetical protein